MLQAPTEVCRAAYGTPSISSPDRLDTSDKKQTRFRCAKLLASVSEAPSAHQAKDVAESLNIEQSVPKC